MFSQEFRAHMRIRTFLRAFLFSSALFGRCLRVHGTGVEGLPDSRQGRFSCLHFLNKFHLICRSGICRMVSRLAQICRSAQSCVRFCDILDRFSTTTRFGPVRRSRGPAIQQAGRYISHRKRHTRTSESCRLISLLAIFSFLCVFS